MAAPSGTLPEIDATVFENSLCENPRDERVVCPVEGLRFGGVALRAKDQAERHGRLAGSLDRVKALAIPAVDGPLFAGPWSAPKEAPEIAALELVLPTIRRPHTADPTLRGWGARRGRGHRAGCPFG